MKSDKIMGESCELIDDICGRGPRGPWGLKLAEQIRKYSQCPSRPARALGVEIPDAFPPDDRIFVEAREGLGG